MTSRVLLIVGIEFLVRLEDAFVLGVSLAHLDLDHDGLLHLRGDDLADLLVAARRGLFCRVGGVSHYFPALAAAVSRAFSI